MSEAIDDGGLRANAWREALFHQVLFFADLCVSILRAYGVDVDFSVLSDGDGDGDVEEPVGSCPCFALFVVGSVAEGY